MSGARDYLTVAPPQGVSYAAPLVGMALGQEIGNYPQDYFQGTQNQRTLELQKPILGPDGQPTTDINTILREMNRRGGGEFVGSLLPFLQKQAVLNQPDTPANPPPAPSPQPPQSSTPNTGPAAAHTAGPANLRLGSSSTPQPQQPSAPQSQPQAAQPQLSSMGTDNNGADTIRSIATEVAGGNDATQAISQVVRALRIHPDAPLSPEQAASIKSQIGAAIRGGSQTAESASSNPTVAPTADNTAPSPSTPPLRNPASALVPQQYAGRELEYAQYLHDLANQDRAQARREGIVGIPSKALEDRAAARDARASRVEEALAKAGEFTPGMREWQASRKPGETQPDYEARAAGMKKAATAPYEIAEAAIREGGRPVQVKPNEVVTTGSQVNPALEGITDWASKRLGLPAEQRVGNTSTPPGPTGTEAPPGQSAFTPKLIRNPDGSVASNVTPSTEALQKEAAQNYEKARETYHGAQEVQMQLAGMEDAARTLNKAGWSTTGTGADARLHMAKAVNSVWQALGVKDQNLPFDPNAVGSWEKLTKETTRLGFSLARTLGAREAAQIVQGSIKANPNIENSPLGFRMVLNSIRQNSERQGDYFDFATRYAQERGGDLVGAEVAFNKLNPPSLYARRAIVQAQRDIPQEAIEALRNDPNTAKAFDDHYGTSGLAKLFLGNAGAAR